MKEIRYTIHGGMVVSEDTKIYGIVSGDLNIVSPATVWIHGIISGDVRLSSGARAYIYGTVTGSVYNSGELEVAGIVKGSIGTDESGHTAVAPGAIVQGILYTIPKS